MEPGLVVAGTYHVVRPIAEGGMGAVYDAIHAKTGRRVALKLIHEHALAKGPSSIRRFAREAKATGAIDSSHVVQVLDAGEDDASGMPFLVMEYLEGEDLRRVLARGRLPEERALAIAVEACRGLVAAHAADVVHRDLKPANLFLADTGDGRTVVKILDFGIAKVLDGDADGDAAALTRTGDVVGSPMYMSPEQLSSPRDVDHRSDLWSLGVVLYEMLSGGVPTADIGVIGARVYAICHLPSPSVMERAVGVSAEVAAVVARALAIDPAARFASAEEMLGALMAAQGKSADASADANANADADADARASAVRRRGWRVVGAAILAVAASAAVAVGVGHSREAHVAPVAAPVAEAAAAGADTTALETVGAAPAPVAAGPAPSSQATAAASPAAAARRVAGNARATIVAPEVRPRVAPPRRATEPTQATQPAPGESAGRDHL